MLTSESFFKELQRLILAHPKRPATILHSENCPYGSYVYFSKNLFYAFDSARSENSMYIYDTFGSMNCIDCAFTVQSELCYECVDVFKCFNCEFLHHCENMTDSSYSYECANCNFVFGCVGLKNRSYCIFNRQLTKEEYEKWLAYYKTLPPEKILAALEILKNYFPLTQTYGLHNENSPYGNNVSFSTNCFMCFDSRNNENSNYLYDSQNNKMCNDLTQCARNQLCFEMNDSGDSFNCNYTVFSASCENSWYAIDCFGVKDSIGCVHVSNRQYCILNRQFSKEDYERISDPLLKDLHEKNLGWANLSF